MSEMNVVEKKREEKLKQLKADYEAVFSSDRGRRVLEDIKASGVWNRSAFSTDSLVMAANCAKQDFARHIVEMSTPSPTENVEKPKKAKRGKHSDSDKGQTRKA